MRNAFFSSRIVLLMQKVQSFSIGIAAVALIVALAMVPTFLGHAAEAKNSERLLLQKTEPSTEDPFPGHESHDIVTIFPPEEGLLYSGTLTFSASRPVEIVVWHEYNQPKDSPANTFQVQKDGKPFAFSLIMLGEGGEDKINEMKGGVRSGSIQFAGSGLALHALDGEPFTVSYSVDGQKQTLQE